MLKAEAAVAKARIVGLVAVARVVELLPKRMSNANGTAAYILLRNYKARAESCCRSLGATGEVAAAQAAPSL